jgi:hypothetical protein
MICDVSPLQSPSAISQDPAIAVFLIRGNLFRSIFVLIGFVANCAPARLYAVI